jgi:hypothetical protein
MLWRNGNLALGHEISRYTASNKPFPYEQVIEKGDTVLKVSYPGDPKYGLFHMELKRPPNPVISPFARYRYVVLELKSDTPGAEVNVGVEQEVNAKNGIHTAIKRELTRQRLSNQWTLYRVAVPPLPDAALLGDSELALWDVSPRIVFRESKPVVVYIRQVYFTDQPG